MIDRDHGVFLFPDTNAHFLGEKPQHVYSVRFAARELWGEQAKPQDTVYVDMWDDYLSRLILSVILLAKPDGSTPCRACRVRRTGRYSRSHGRPKPLP